MTSFIGDEDEYTRAISHAVESGASVKILLMMPSMSAPVVRARFSDTIQPGISDEVIDKEMAEFVAKIRPKAISLLKLRDIIQEKSRASRGINGLEVRFFKRSLNFPMVYIKYPPRKGYIEEVVYTGFYTKINAEDMPYIEWRGGNFPVGKMFLELFNNKWDACKKNTKLEG